MSFKILYVEDNADHAQSVKAAVAREAKALSRPLIIETVDKPEKVPDELTRNYDLLLADCLFPDKYGDEQPRLDDIIRSAQEWSRANRLERPLPIIAYTRRERGALNYCLERRRDLYDIWDKASASPPYAAWRLSRIALEISRTRPDALLQRKIRTLESGARWHQHVQEMARRYSNGWTEADQIEQAGKCILDIASELNAYKECQAYWAAMSEWESLGRAVSRRVRGHARHVINVFWLGYLILHDPGSREWFIKIWQKLVARRRDMDAVANTNAIEALSDCWFYAGLFHDVANCVQERESVPEKLGSVLKGFEDFIEIRPGGCSISKDATNAVDELFKDLEEISVHLKPLWEASLETGQPDHGIFGGSHIMRKIDKRGKPQQHCFAREAARAMAIHNLIGKLPAAPDGFLSWEEEPIACLLLLCDQIQTWDRERGDKRMSEKDGPERAELLAFKVENNAGAVRIELGIDYIAPRYLDHAPEIFTRVKDALEEIIEEKPKAALSRIKGSWPFGVSVNCWLSGQPLSRKMSFPLEPR